MDNVKIGIKIVNYYPNKENIIKLLEYFKIHQTLFLELGFYYERNLLDVVFFGYAMNEYQRINFHSSYKYHLFSIEDNLNGINEDLKLAKSLNSNYSIIHLTPNQKFEEKYSKKKLINKTVENLKKLNETGEYNHYYYYLENTFHNIDFYESVFDKVTDLNLKKIHFCFDVGHAKVWSENNVREWLLFIDHLVNENRKIHFHLHLNHGKQDEHLSFPEFQSDFTDGFSNGQNYESLFSRIIHKYPDSRKIFEVKTEKVLDNLDYVQDHILNRKLLGEKEKQI